MMWSKSFINEYKTFYCQYTIELLHLLGSVIDNNYSTNENLRNMMIELAKRDDKCFYQLALYAYKRLQRNNSFYLTTAFNDEEFTAIYDSHKKDEENLDKTQSYDVATVHVTPTSTRIMPLEQIQGHRALRHKAFNDIIDFCLVYLKSDSPAKYINKCNRFKNFLVVSNSQLREHSYWFIRATSLEEAHQKRENLGDFSDITNIDGNGLISKGLARKIAEQLDYLVKCEQNELYPSVYQIRMAGFPTRLNNQIIMLLSDLGVPNSVLLDLQDKWSNNKKQPPRYKIDMLKNKIPLPMNQCRYMFGHTLESKLEPGQCFIRYQIVDDNGKPLKNPEF
ncbi:unnamed protein product [Rotaria sordida]|uniref:Uncharacterized protein n=1 Tax=Rotaria sordida TaxID=392033 RepID=A0A814CE29_9BILA|nr:unnamed protein product [Rotaria sordida]